MPARSLGEAGASSRDALRVVGVRLGRAVAPGNIFKLNPLKKLGTLAERATFPHFILSKNKERYLKGFLLGRDLCEDIGKDNFRGA